MQAAVSHSHLGDHARKAAVEREYLVSSQARPMRHQCACRVVVTGAATVASSRADMLKRREKLATSASWQLARLGIGCYGVTRSEVEVPFRFCQIRRGSGSAARLQGGSRFRLCQFS